MTLIHKESKLKLEGFHENVNVAPLLNMTKCPTELKALCCMCFSKCLQCGPFWSQGDLFTRWFLFFNTVFQIIKGAYDNYYQLWTLPTEDQPEKTIN